MKTLILCRHAKSDWPAGVPDIQRPLRQRGIRDAKFLGDLLQAQEFQPDCILTSPAQRARQTADVVAACISYPGEIIEQADIYYRGEEALIRMIRALSPTLETVMIFGHNPTMEDAVRMLLGAEADFELPTSAMACFESRINDWAYFATSNLHLRWLLVPRLKRKES